MHPHRLAAAALVAALAAPAGAQLAPTPRAVGLAGAQVAGARGLDALWQSPANLALTDGPGWSFALPQAALGETVVGYDWRELQDIGRRDELGQARRSELLARLPRSGTEAQGHALAPLFGLQVGPVAVGAALGAVGRHSIGKDVVDLALNGYTPGRYDYQVGDTRGSSATYADVAVGLGHRFGPLSVGVTGHWYRGHSLHRTRLFEPTFDVAREDVRVDYVGVSAEGGSGYGVDVGLAAQAGSRLTVSAAATNLFHRMRWTESLGYREVSLDRRSMSGLSELFGRFRDSERPLDASAVPVRVYETAQDLYAEAYFPTTVRAGAEWKPFVRTSVMGAVHAQVTGGALGGWWRRTAAAGVEQRLGPAAVRAGYATDLREGSMASAGLSLGPLEAGAARLVGGVRDGVARTGWAATAGVTFRGK